MEPEKSSVLIFIKKSFNQYVPALLQQPIRQFFFKPLKQLVSLLKDMWLPIYRIERSGLTVILIGHEACDPLSDKVCDPYIINLLFAEYIEPIKIGVVPLWSLNRVMRRWENKADLIIFRHRRFKPLQSAARQMLSMPFNVVQLIDLPPPSDADLLTFFSNAKTRSSDLKKIRNADFQYEITHDPVQLEFFYHQMYLPYIHDRHRELGRSLPWEVFREYYQEMELLLIRKDGVPVSGCLNLQTGDCYTSHVLGVLNGDSEWVKAGCIAALYWFSIIEAYQRGCATVSLLFSRPFLKDGVMVYKKKWASRIVADHTDRELWLLLCSKNPSMQFFLEENPFICEQDGRLVSLIFLGSHTILNDQELSCYLKGCQHDGDQLSTCVVLLTTEWVDSTDTIQNILNELPQSYHLLDLSHGSLTELPELISSRRHLFPGLAASSSGPAYS